MTSMANAFRKAMGVPENNNIQPIITHPINEDVILDQLDDRDNTRFGLGEEERVNEHGCKELGFWGTGPGKPSWFPICAQCGAHTMPNRGQGMICDRCNDDTISEMSHDYDMGLF